MEPKGLQGSVLQMGAPARKCLKPAGKRRGFLIAYPDQSPPLPVARRHKPNDRRPPLAGEQGGFCGNAVMVAQHAEALVDSMARLTILTDNLNQSFLAIGADEDRRDALAARATADADRLIVLVEPALILSVPVGWLRVAVTIGV
jgi:hypothetical protein